MTKDDIIGTAFKVWGRDLYRTTSLTPIARELGVSKPALYRHFKDKKALLGAMHEAYFNNCAAFIREGYEHAIASSDRTESILIMMRTFAEYYIRNREAFVFSLICIFSKDERETIGSQFFNRGIDLQLVVNKDGGGALYPSKFQLIVQTIIFNISVFHRFGYKHGEIPSNNLIKKTLVQIETQVLQGLGLHAKRIAAMNYLDLEEKAAKAVYQDTESNILLRAVAETVAEAGPWNASMEMIARRSGLSKSGLYAHFKSKQDMLGELFITEYVRILNFARAQVEVSEVAEEQLFLAICTIVNYLRSRPEILVAMDWIKAGRLELGKNGTVKLYRIIKGIKLEAIRKHDPHSLVRIAQWLLFMIVNTLAWWSAVQRQEKSTGKQNRNIDWAKNITEIPNESFRILFRFIALGLEGLNDV